MIDPQDWNIWRSGPHGARVRRTAADITAAVFQELPHVTGNVILLHDGGGNRAVTIQALNQIIPRLQQRGYTFVPVSQLAGLSRATVMPPLTRKDTLLVGYDRLAFGTLFTLERLLTLAFIIAILLGIGRVLLIVPLAMLAERRSLPDLPTGAELPLVSVLIAAYNEAPVIARTLRSLLRSDYPDLEVVVVDDGSTDGTAEAVASAFSAEPRVRLLRQENSGKAAALNLAIAKARGPVLMCLDADTQIAPDCIGQLVRHFQDPTVGAVAGNVKVGNRHNLLTRWQAIEYITSQNLDREAYALLNAITVVPGAVGAWRRQAVLDAGGYLHDTLAEDMDLTWRIRRQGWQVETDRSALGYTEVPDTLGAFCKQRFRWAYGTLQCLWKHRDALGHYGFFGRLALPTLWIFQILFQVLAPLVDLRVAVTLGSFGIAWLSHGVLHQDWQPLPGMMHVLTQTLFSYAVFFTFELGGSLVAFRMDRERPGILWWLFWQRFVYRQLMYFVVWKSLWTALKGTRQGWGKLERKGTVLLAGLLEDTGTAPDGE